MTSISSAFSKISSGKCFPDNYTCYLSNCIRTAFEMLYINSCINIYTVIENFQDILISFCMPAARSICMCKFVNKYNPGFSGYYRIEIHFINSCRFVLVGLTGYHFKTFYKIGCFFPVMCFNIPDNNITTF